MRFYSFFALVVTVVLSRSSFRNMVIDLYKKEVVTNEFHDDDVVKDEDDACKVLKNNHVSSLPHVHACTPDCKISFDFMLFGVVEVTIACSNDGFRHKLQSSELCIVSCAIHDDVKSLGIK